MVVFMGEEVEIYVGKFRQLLVQNSIKLMTKLSFVTDSFFFRLPLVGTKIESREGLKLANELDLEMKFRIKDDKNGNTSFREIRLSPQNGISTFPHFLVKSFRILSVRAYERPR